MNITSVSYVKSINGTDSILTDGKWQVAFVGRSNVGKSSLINSLVHQKLARSSKTPGKTKLLDFFLINNRFYFVDLPGYGFAHRSSKDREHFRKLMMWYFEYANVTKRIVIHIVDSVIGLTDFDLQMIDYLHELHIPSILVANKFDKLSFKEKQDHLKEIISKSGSDTVIPYSTITNEGKSKLLQSIEHMLM